MTMKLLQESMRVIPCKTQHINDTHSKFFNSFPPPQMNNPSHIERGGSGVYNTQSVLFTAMYIPPIHNVGGVQMLLHS